VTPNLPKDLKLDPETGVISGVINNAVEAKTYRVTAANSTGSTSCELTFACTTSVDSITGVDQQFAQSLEEIVDIAELVVKEPKKEKSLGDWMVWMVHRVSLNDPNLTEFNFTGKHMPPPHLEPRIAPKLIKSLAHNTNLLSLQLADSNLMKPQGHDLAASLAKNTTLQLLNIETNNLDATGVKHIAEALLGNPDSALEQWKFSNQKILGASFGRPVEQAVAELMEKNTRIVKLGFSCNDPNWRLNIDRALLRNNDFARRRRKGCPSMDENEVTAQEKPISRMVIESVPDTPAEEVFNDAGEQTLLVRAYLQNSKRFPTREQLQSFAKSQGKPLPYSAVAPLAKSFRAKLLDAAVGCQVEVFDVYGAGFTGYLRSWTEKNEHWSLDLWMDDGTRFNCTSAKQPGIEVSAEFAEWQKPMD